MAIYKIQNCSSLKYLDSNINQLSDFNSINNERPSVTTENSNSSISQKWIIDSISGNTYIRSCVDHNMCLSRFENATTHQCAMSLEKCYSNYRSSFSPLIQLVSASGGVYRIKLVNSNMYLTVLSSGAVSWGGLSSSDEKQLWTLSSTSATTNYTLDVYQNMNQKYSGYAGKMLEGCEAASYSNAAAFYHKGYYTYDEMLSDGFVDGDEAGWVKNYNACRYVKKANEYTSINYSNIKNQLDSEHPVLIRIINSTTGKGHTVMAYGYQNSCTTTSDLLVLDPANTHNDLDDIGLFFTLTESMTHNSKNAIDRYITTEEK